MVFRDKQPFKDWHFDVIAVDFKVAEVKPKLFGATENIFEC